MSAEVLQHMSVIKTLERLSIASSCIPQASIACSPHDGFPFRSISVMCLWAFHKRLLKAEITKVLWKQ